ncbi:tetratricopeptide repeat protein [Limnoraphis robusta]|uniref:Tetratricopeptide repeat protein n=1 Tax=Limnoraphis robusta CCNP1315 TaxID=3110306 RepID=A0ABU5TUN1_9CYAN|nr:tetratricopeptide repeat protein [Limnoraphis robusta]MEA5518611.1 tetratricopeptide repeat protein [Limnoraphis robusta CCNP1315]MEA5547994.1 tetratricopeptide repeat protein [Limnoraphis robusta CCNP1324]
MNPPSDRDRYQTFVEQIIASILKGQIASKALIYQRLVDELQPGTGEIFERCLMEKISSLESLVKTESDELKQAKATRQLRAIKMLQQAWEEWQKNHQAESSCAVAVRQILEAEATQRLSVLLQVLDPNQSYVFKHPQIRQLAQSLQQEAEGLTNPSEAFELRQYALGLMEGLASVSELEPHLISWVYDLPNRALGFGGGAMNHGPWQSWAKQVSSPLAKELFTKQAQNQSAALVATEQTIDWKAWVGLMVLMRDLQTGLVAWFDKQPYSAQFGQNLSGVTFLVFAMIWSELSSGLKLASQQPEREVLSQACFQISLQILRTFAQRDNFPLYGGVFASFSGQGFRETINYLNQPLNFAENIQEKARILTVLGYSQQWIGHHEQAWTLHQEALELARQTEDRACEVANFNHLSRLSWRQKDYSQAITFAQRALILARQIGDRKGEAHCLVSLGFCEVLMARQQRTVTFEQLESSISYLEQGLKLSEKFNDLLNQALSSLGLGIAYVVLEKPTQAVPILEEGLLRVQQVGERDLQALGYACLGEAYYQLHREDLAVYHACLGMYLLEQRGDIKWQQAGALVMILQGKLGSENFQNILSQNRSKFIALIGIDGFDYLPSLIERYRQQS